MKRINQSPRSLLVVSLLAMTVTLTACGTEEPTKSTKDAGSSADGTAAVDGGSSDSIMTKADTATVSQDSGTTTAVDAGPTPKTSCGDALLCTSGCGKTDTACKDGCVDNVTAADKKALSGIATCAVDLCKAVTEGTAAEQECAYGKCYDKYASCSEFGGGKASCVATVGCFAACRLTDLGCRLRCSTQAGKEALPLARATAVCVATKCKGIKDQGGLATCVATKCTAEIKTCLGAESFGCLDITVYVATCAKPSALEPNNCLGIIRGIADAGSRTAYDALTVCKKQCLQENNITGCWGKKCIKESTACFVKVGKTNCQDIDECVSLKCNGIGGDTDCIKKCLPIGKPASQDAYLAYEGCMVRNMDKKEAKFAKCKFPYDIAQCVTIIKKQFCGNETSNCFTDQ